MSFKGTRWLLLKNPWNLSGDQKERLSDARPLERADHPRLLPQRSLSTVLGLQAAQAGQRPFREMDAVCHEFAPGALQEICAHAPVSTAFTESAVNQLVSRRMVKQQQMHWTERGAHLLLQVRVQVMNGDLRQTFGRWYPWVKTATEPCRWSPDLNFHTCPGFENYCQPPVF